MDIRPTTDLRTFIQLLQELKEQQGKASLLFDENGLDRAEGHITALELSDSGGKVTLDTGLTIDISTIVALNGQFLSDFSAC